MMELGNPPPNPPEVWKVKGIAKPRVNRKAFAIDHPRFGGNGKVFSNSRDEAARNNNSGVLDGRTGNRDDLGAANGEVLRLAALRVEKWRSTEESQQSRKADRQGTPKKEIGTHARLLAKTLKGQPSPGNRKGRRMRLVGSFGRVKVQEAGKKIRNPETKCRGHAFLLLHSHRDCSI